MDYFFLKKKNTFMGSKTCRKLNTKYSSVFELEFLFRASRLASTQDNNGWRLDSTSLVVSIYWRYVVQIKIDYGIYPRTMNYNI
jgi:hypothetical protein